MNKRTVYRYREELGLLLESDCWGNVMSQWNTQVRHVVRSPRWNFAQRGHMVWHCQQGWKFCTNVSFWPDIQITHYAMSWTKDMIRIPSRRCVNSRRRQNHHQTWTKSMFASLSQPSVNSPPVLWTCGRNDKVSLRSRSVKKTSTSDLESRLVQQINHAQAFGAMDLVVDGSGTGRTSW